MKKILLLALLFVGVSSFCVLNSESSFEAKFEIKNDRLEIKNANGFTFNTIAFTKKKNIYFNQSGMVNMKVKSEIENSDFIFKINRKNNKIQLEGIKNINWKTLEFKEKATINQDGITR